MLGTLAVFLVVLVWGLHDGDIDGREAACFGVAFAALVGIGLAFADTGLWMLAATAVLDIALVWKVFGGDLPIR